MARVKYTYAACLLRFSHSYKEDADEFSRGTSAEVFYAREWPVFATPEWRRTNLLRRIVFVFVGAKTLHQQTAAASSAFEIGRVGVALRSASAGRLENIRRRWVSGRADPSVLDPFSDAPFHVMPA